MDRELGLLPPLLTSAPPRLAWRKRDGQLQIVTDIIGSVAAIVPACLAEARSLGYQDRGHGMASGIGYAQATEQGQANEPRQAAGQADQAPPMTAEAARRLAALLAPHLLAMRAVTAGTRFGACAGPAAASAPPASPATRIFIAGMLERISG